MPFRGLLVTEKQHKDICSCLIICIKLKSNSCWTWVSPLSLAKYSLVNSTIRDEYYWTREYIYQYTNNVNWLPLSLHPGVLFISFWEFLYLEIIMVSNRNEKDFLKQMIGFKSCSSWCDTMWRRLSPWKSGIRYLFSRRQNGGSTKWFQRHEEE